VQNEKREMLRNAVLNSALGSVDENVRQIFMQYIERLTPMHMALLKLYNNPLAVPAAKKRLEQLAAGGMIELVRAAIPNLPEALAGVFASDLENLKLVNGGALNVTMTAQGMGARRTTDLGEAFLKFLSEPALA
jgi:hypothetical protein